MIDQVRMSVARRAQNQFIALEHINKARIALSNRNRELHHVREQIGQRRGRCDAFGDMVQKAGVELLKIGSSTGLTLNHRCWTLLHSTYRVAVWLGRANSSVPNLNSK